MPLSKQWFSGKWYTFLTALELLWHLNWHSILEVSEKMISLLQSVLINQHNNFLFLLHCLYSLISIDIEIHRRKGISQRDILIFSISVRDTLDKCNRKVNVFKAWVKCDELLCTWDEVFSECIIKDKIKLLSKLWQEWFMLKPLEK